MGRSPRARLVGGLGPETESEPGAVHGALKSRNHPTMQVLVFYQKQEMEAQDKPSFPKFTESGRPAWRERRGMHTER